MSKLLSQPRTQLGTALLLLKSNLDKAVLITRFYLIPQKCHLLFGGPKIRPSGLALAIQTHIRQKTRVLGSGLSLEWLQGAGWRETIPSSQLGLPAATQGVLGGQCPQGRAAGDTAAEEGPQGAPALLCWPQHASPSSWLALGPWWLPARRPQCTGRKKKQLCFAQSLAINQVPISSQSHVPHPKCTRQLQPWQSP